MKIARDAGILALAMVLMAAAVRVESFREARFPVPQFDPDQEVLYFRSGSELRRASNAFSTLAADLYWIRAIQYFGGTRRRLAAGMPGQPGPPRALSVDSSTGSTSDYSLLYPLLDITTTLDPRFNIAYRFGAVFLAESYPGGPGRPDLAVDLLEKGLRERPDKWEYMEDIGFVQYWYSHDYRAAAGWFEKASAVPGAPWWLRSLAASMLAEGGDRRSSRLMWEAIRQSAEIDWLRQDAERRLMQLSALDAIEALEKPIQAFTTKRAHAPAAWADLIRAGLVPGVPLDPTGIPYELLPDGHVGVSRSSALFPLPEEPGLSPRPPA
jgi:hypothetical protein